MSSFDYESEVYFTDAGRMISNADLTNMFKCDKEYAQEALKNGRAWTTEMHLTDDCGHRHLYGTSIVADSMEQAIELAEQRNLGERVLGRLFGVIEAGPDPADEPDSADWWKQ